MKYIIRVLKYILFLCLFLAIIVFVLQALGMTEDGFRNIFVPGSLWKVAAIIGAVVDSLSCCRFPDQAHPSARCI